MAVSLSLYKDGLGILFDTPVSVEKYYHDTWDKANKELGIKLFIAYGKPFRFDDIPEVLDELTRLKSWAEINEHSYMSDRIDELMEIIPQICDEYSSREDASELYFYL
ncbi:MAG: hypothetical protein HDT25_05885 [Ruminococcus sp.]|nr:hypothetical protein [Ruminococcus sp.]